MHIGKKYAMARRRRDMLFHILKKDEYERASLHCQE